MKAEEEDKALRNKDRMKFVIFPLKFLLSFPAYYYF